MDDKHGTPGLHAAAGPGLAEECALLVRGSLGSCLSDLVVQQRHTCY